MAALTKQLRLEGFGAVQQRAMQGDRSREKAAEDRFHSWPTSAGFAAHGSGDTRPPVLGGLRGFRDQVERSGEQ